MNKTIAWIGSIVVVITVALFAVFMFVSDFGSYVVCIFLALGYLLMIAGFHNESCKKRKVAANIGLVFGCIYAVLILLVYFAQVTAVRKDAVQNIIKKSHTHRLRADNKQICSCLLSALFSI